MNEFRRLAAKIDQSTCNRQLHEAFGRLVERIKQLAE